MVGDGDDGTASAGTAKEEEEEDRGGTVVVRRLHEEEAYPRCSNNSSSNDDDDKDGDAQQQQPPLVGSSDGDDGDGGDDYDRDKIRKQKVVVEALRRHCLSLVADAEAESSIPKEDADDDNDDHPDVLRRIGAALAYDEGAVLKVENLSGGYTNYTYRAYLERPGQNPPSTSTATSSTSKPLQLFVKLCFERAFWNPDATYAYDLSRIENERYMLEAFARVAPSERCVVATPYLLLDVVDDRDGEGGGGPTPAKMKLLATEWCERCEEQLSQQFVRGRADARLARNLAAAVAALHYRDSADTPIMPDDDFNTEARECILNIFPTIQDELRRMIRQRQQPVVSTIGDQTCNIGNNGNDVSDNTGGKFLRSAEVARELGGMAFCEEVFRAAARNYRERDIPVHADLHAFNVLVERRRQPPRSSSPSEVGELQQRHPFGPDGAFCVCDWEMSMMGPRGLDTGRVFSIPVACVVAHAYYGGARNRVVDGGGDDEDCCIDDEIDTDAAIIDNLMTWIDAYWDSYSSSVLSNLGRHNGDDDGNTESVVLRSGYRNALAWLGWKLFAIGAMGWFVPFLPVDEEDTDAFKDSLCVLGLKFMHYGFCKDEEHDALSLGELVSLFRSTIREEVACIKSLSLSSSSPNEAVRRKRSSSRRSSILRDGKNGRRVSDSFQTMDRASLKKAVSEGLDLTEGVGCNGGGGDL